MRGRPTKLTPEVRDAIVNAVSCGNYPEIAAESEGVDRATFYRWMHAVRPTRAATTATSRDAVMRARAKAERKMVRIVRRAAIEDAQSAQWYLSAARPDRWGRRDKVQVENAVRDELAQAPREVGGGPEARGVRSVSLQCSRMTALARERLRARQTTKAAASTDETLRAFIPRVRRSTSRRITSHRSLALRADRRGREGPRVRLDSAAARQDGDGPSRARMAAFAWRSAWRITTRRISRIRATTRATRRATSHGAQASSL